MGGRGLTERGAGPRLATALLVIGVAALSAGPAVAAARVQTDPRDVSQPLDLVQASLVQRGDLLHLSIDTHEKFDGALLSSADGRSLCLLLRYGQLSTPRARVCALPVPGQNRLRLRYTRLDPFGAPYRVRPLSTVVIRPDGRRLRAALSAADLGLSAGQSFTWQIRSSWTNEGACEDAATPVCSDLLPDAGPVPMRIVARPRESAERRPTGCVATGPVERRDAVPHLRRQIALTFDDGPGPYTRQVLRILRRTGVPATFFLVGQQVRQAPALVRTMLRDGHMLANHSLSHANLGSGGARAADEIGRTQAIIRRATGFTPCLFRPPYGSTSGALNRVVRAHGMLSILWDVDTNDWRRPGAGTIAGRIIGQVRGGSVVLLHDAGGNRQQTIAALEPTIRLLKRRGYELVTLTNLFGLKLQHDR